MARAVYLRETIVFTVIFHITCISYNKSIKSTDDNFKIKSKLQVIYPFILLKINGYSISATIILQNQRRV